MNKQAKRIALVMTGGTISTVLSGGIMRTDNDVAAKFSHYHFKKIVEPLKLLSENLGFSEINAIYDAVKKIANDDEIDAIILTHGTDSLSYSATALALMLHDINKPIVYVSADYPLSDPRSNGVKNMEAAVEFVNAVDFGGVFVAYKNIGESDTKIHFAARLNYTRGFDGLVSSALNRICGAYENKTLTVIERPRNCFIDEKNTCIKGLGLDTANEGRVILIQAYVGLCYKALAKMQEMHDFEIIHDSYHSGTVKTSGENHIGLLRGSVLIAGGVKGDKYASVLELKGGKNIRFIDNISPIALYFKRVLSLGMNEKLREEYLNTNTANEYF